MLVKLLGVEPATSPPLELVVAADLDFEQNVFQIFKGHLELLAIFKCPCLASV